MLTLEEILSSTNEQFDDFAVGMEGELRNGGHCLHVTEVACLVLHHQIRIKEMQETIIQLIKTVKHLAENNGDAGIW